MKVSRRQNTGVRVKLQGAEIVKVDEFKYLGSAILRNGQCTRELEKRVQAGCSIRDHFLYIIF